MVRDCRGSDQYVFGGPPVGPEIGYPRGQFSFSVHGVEGALVNRQGKWLHRYRAFSASGTINHMAGSITYQVAGCRVRHYVLRAGR